MAANSTPRRASAAPAVVAWRSPRAVSSRSASGFESCGTASPCRRIQSCWATRRRLTPDAESDGPLELARPQRQRVAPRLELLARQADLVPPRPHAQRDAAHAPLSAPQRAAHAHGLLRAEGDGEEDGAAPARRAHAERADGLRLAR